MVASDKDKTKNLERWVQDSESKKQINMDRVRNFIPRKLKADGSVGEI